MSIDALYEQALSELTTQGKIQSISRMLLFLKTNNERVLYIFDILSNLELLPKPLEVTKSVNVSTYYRNYGNQCFQKKDDYRAWQYYNLSLLHAPVASENYPLALANRSAVFYSLKKYKECLQDIQTVFSMQYPEKLKDKLSKRLALCEEMVSKEKEHCNEASGICEDIKDMLSLQGPIDPRYPCASSKLDVVFSEEMGRHVIAREDIKVGEVLIQENPYLTVLLKTQYLFSCSYCLSRSLNLLPCPNCCFSLYCSTECMDKALKDYHSVECPIMPSLIHMQFTKLELLALRIVIKARNDHLNWEEMFQTIEMAEANMNSEFRGHTKINGIWVYDSKYYASIHTLASNIEKRSVSDIFQKSVSAAVFLHLLSEKTDFLVGKEENLKEKIYKCVAGTLLLHIMTSPTNMHGLSTNVETHNGHFVEEISLASAPYAYHSLLNHSCAPNVVRFVKLGTGQMTCFALRPIKKGMQLFDNYGPHHAIQCRNSRQENLRFQYKFTCVCEACVDDWPTYLRMGPSSNLPLDIIKCKQEILDSKTIEKLQKGDEGTALKLYKPLCELLEILDAYAPCMEYADCQESLKQCLVIIKGILPYGYSNLVEWDAIPPTIT